MSLRKDIDLRVYLVTDQGLCTGRELADVVAEAVDGGATVVQLREKHLSTREFVNLALQVKPLLQRAGVPLIINDRVDVALAVGADGVHVGQSDMEYEMVRALMGPDAVIGLSIDNMDQLREAESIDVDYLGIGPIAATTTKPDAAQPVGIDGFAKMIAASRHRCVAIGSVGTPNASDLIRAGADGLAVVSAICSAHSPRDAARALLQQFTLK